MTDGAAAMTPPAAGAEPLPATSYKNPQGERVNPNTAPSTTPAQQQPPAAAQGGSGRESAGTGKFCPDHPKVELILSKREYQEYDDVDGVQVPAKFFCPRGKNGTDTNHQVWRSKALVRGLEAATASEVTTPAASAEPPMPVEPDDLPF